MANKVVDIKSRTARGPGLQAAEVWHCQINLRLAQIERQIKRLEWQLWALLCGGATFAVLGLIDRVPTQ